MSRPGSRVNIRDVAREAGVSVSTVSRVLNRKDDVAAATAANVRRVIEELGYASDLAARSLRTHTTNVVGLIVPYLWHPFTSMVIKGINQVTDANGYDLMGYACSPQGGKSMAVWEQTLVTQLNGTLTDGIIVVTPKASTFRTTYPLVAVDPQQQCNEFPAIISTNHHGVLEAMGYLVDLGHERIGFIGGRTDLQSARRRLEGYIDGLKLAGVAVDSTLIVTGNYTREAGVDCARQLLSLPHRPTAIIAANDETAFGVYDAAAELGLTIPNDLSVIGFDNTIESGSVSPPLTTVDQSVEEMGRMAAEIALKLIQGEKWDIQLMKVPTKLIIRQSCGTLRC